MGETKVICIKNISDNCQCPLCKQKVLSKSIKKRIKSQVNYPIEVVEEKVYEHQSTTTYTMDELFPEHSNELTDKES